MVGDVRFGVLDGRVPGGLGGRWGGAEAAGAAVGGVLPGAAAAGR